MMPPIILTVLQGLFLLLLYLFVARAVRAVIRDVTAPAQPRRRGPPPQTRQRQPAQRQPQRRPAQPARQSAPPRAPSAAPRATPRELVVHLAEGRPRVVALDGQEITFGRSQQASVPLGDPYASDRHARVHFDGSRWLVSDLGSTNGTFLNQAKVTEPTPLAAGDQLRVGQTVVEVRQ